MALRIILVAFEAIEFDGALRVTCELIGPQGLLTKV